MHECRVAEQQGGQLRPVDNPELGAGFLLPVRKHLARNRRQPAVGDDQSVADRGGGKEAERLPQRITLTRVRGILGLNDPRVSPFSPPVPGAVAIMSKPRSGPTFVRWTE